MRFALGPLTQTLDLEIALGHVVTDAVAGDMVERVGLGDVLGAGADDGGDFDFPVELGRAARLLDGVVGAGEGGVGFQEEDRLGRNRISGLLGMVDIVQPDGDELRDAGDGGAQPRLAADGGKLGGVELGKLLQRSRRVGCAIEIPDLLRQVAQLAGFVDQALLFRALRAVTNKLHFLTPFGVS